MTGNPVRSASNMPAANSKTCSRLSAVKVLHPEGGHFTEWFLPVRVTTSSWSQFLLPGGSRGQPPVLASWLLVSGRTVADIQVELAGACMLEMELAGAQELELTSAPGLQTLQRCQVAADLPGHLLKTGSPDICQLPHWPWLDGLYPLLELPHGSQPLDAAVQYYDK